MAAVRDALGRAGVECCQYCGHSFRIGAATTAAARGIEDSLIKTLGKWKSLAYLCCASLCDECDFVLVCVIYVMLC